MVHFNPESNNDGKVLIKTGTKVVETKQGPMTTKYSLWYNPKLTPIDTSFGSISAGGTQKVETERHELNVKINKIDVELAKIGAQLDALMAIYDSEFAPTGKSLEDFEKAYPQFNDLNKQDEKLSEERSKLISEVYQKFGDQSNGINTEG